MHESTTDPNAKLFRKGDAQPAKLYFMGHREPARPCCAGGRHAGHRQRRAAGGIDDDQSHDPGSERRLTLAADKIL
jgi:hypothetical protein